MIQTFVPSFKKRHVPLREGQADKQLGFIVNQAGSRRLYREQMVSRSTLHIKQKENQNDTHGRRGHSRHLVHQFPKRWCGMGCGDRREWSRFEHAPSTF